RSLLIPILIFHGLEFIVLIIFTIFEEGPINRCYIDGVPPFEMNAVNLNPASLEDIILSDVKPPPGRAIFFHEIRCHPGDVHRVLQLTARQACAIESAALHNPHFQVFVLFESPTHMPVGETFPLLDAIQSYRNVHFRQLNIWSFAEGTPIEDWAKKAELLYSRFLMVNLSDLLRLLTLYRFGGIYMDMDVIVLRSFENEPPNFVGAESKVKIGNSILRLEPKGFGHKIIEYFLLDYQMNYNGDIWAVNGPVSLSRVMSYICNTNNITVMQSDQRRCQGIKVFRSSDFYAISDWAYFFEPEFANETMELLKNSYAAHLWGHISTQRDLRVNSNAAYIQLATQNCPKVLAAARKWF
ncbi:hypothetical protein KR215_004643, partial [Drosophila sulfurigaster]